MRALGIDPGSRVTGWGVVDGEGNSFRHVASDTLVLAPHGSLAARLARLHAEVLRLVVAWAPDAVVLERAFVARNVQSALRLGETRGAVLAAVAAAGSIVHEYAPAAVKLAAVGHGRAGKTDVVRGVMARFRLAEAPRFDAADALALALCHLQQEPLRRRTAAELQRQSLSIAASRRATVGRAGRTRAAREP